MDREEFESVLDRVARRLNSQLRGNVRYSSSREFEEAVRKAFQREGEAAGLQVDFDPHPHIFPDVVIGEFGVEIKYSDKDTWRSVANSIFEGRRDKGVKQIYLLFGKMGGLPEVRYSDYAESVIHVRTSHVPRFEVEISEKQSLFDQFGVTYLEFQRLPIEEKMEKVRRYARSRLKPGERLWWLEDAPGEAHSLPMQARLYMSLEQDEKRQIRAEGTLLCPGVVRPSRSKNKYDDVALYALTYRGVLCTQVRDLFSAGSVALRADAERGGNYIMRAIADIEEEMTEAAERLDNSLFEEYWGRSVKPKDRIREWLQMADALAVDWRPSRHLFLRR